MSIIGTWSCAVYSRIEYDTMDVIAVSWRVWAAVHQMDSHASCMGSSAAPDGLTCLVYGTRIIMATIILLKYCSSMRSDGMVWTE